MINIADNANEEISVSSAVFKPMLWTRALIGQNFFFLDLIGWERPLTSINLRTYLSILYIIWYTVICYIQYVRIFIWSWFCIQQYAKDITIAAWTFLPKLEREFFCKRWNGEYETDSINIRLVLKWLNHLYTIHYVTYCMLHAVKFIWTV